MRGRVHGSIGRVALAGLALLGSSGGGAQADVFALESGRDSIGEPGQMQAEREDTLPDIARRYHLGFDEIIAANPGVDTWLPGAGTRVRLPTQHLLPAVPRTGIVINLPDGRLYYFHTDAHGNPIVETYPISVGKMDWKTPIGLTTVVEKSRRPT